MDRRWSNRKYLYHRIALEVPSYNKVVAGALLDISLGGAFIETEVLLPSNVPLSFELKLPVNLPQSSFRLNARVIRRESRGVGVAFVGMPDNLIHAFSEALARFECHQQESDLMSGFAKSGKSSPYRRSLS